jgi:ATP-dependent RNA helicase RhlE
MFERYPLTSFTDLGLAEPLLKALRSEGYDTPTPIQAQAIPGVMQGKDLLGIAQTGTGKTAAFALPILHRLASNRIPAQRRGCRVLVLSPTRELASQIAESFRTYGKHLGFTVALIYGGVKYGPQMRALAGGVDIVVATPGRLIDHLQEKVANFSSTEIFVLDEADQMLDLGFLAPIRKIVSHLPKDRQNLFFSATMPAEIGKLAGELLKDPVKVSVAPTGTTVERIDQRVIFVEGDRKRALLAELFEEAKIDKAIVFTRTKRGADRVAKSLEAAGISAASIHGDKSQAQRERALAAFKAGACRAMVATDIAARGIDIDAVSHVVNFELPNVPESYVHRIGRTARAGAKGSAISLCADDERNLLRDIQKLTRQTIPASDRRRDQSLAVMTKAISAQEGVQESRWSPVEGADERPKSRQPHRGGGGRPGHSGQNRGGADRNARPASHSANAPSGGADAAKKSRNRRRRPSSGRTAGAVA